MTAQPIEHGRPARGYIDRTLDAVAVAITTQAVDPVETARFVREFHEAWAAVSDVAADVHDITPLVALVERWWPTAAMWDADPEGSRRAHVEAERLAREGPTLEQVGYWSSVRSRPGKTAADAAESRAKSIAWWERFNGPMGVEQIAQVDEIARRHDERAGV